MLLRSALHLKRHLPTPAFLTGSVLYLEGEMTSGCRGQISTGAAARSERRASGSLYALRSPSQATVYQGLSHALTVELNDFRARHDGLLSPRPCFWDDRRNR